MISLGFEVVCGVLWYGLWCFVVWFVVFCGGLWCFVVVCGVLWCLVPPAVDIADIVDWDHKPHLNMCALN